MNLKGLKINFLGDSITEGHGTTEPDKVFHQLIKEKYGLTEARNYGIGGTRIAKQSKPSENPRWDLDFNSRCDEMSDDADAVVVFGGTNDYGHGDAKIGTFEDMGVYTFYGALRTLMEKLINKYPGKPIVFVTPLHRMGEKHPMGDKQDKVDYNTLSAEEKAKYAPLSEYVRIIKEAAEYYSIPVIDLYAISGIQPEVEILREKFCPDGLHPNDEGHKLMAERIGNYLKAL